MKLSEIDPDITDPDTGLPKLPENYFFRVKKESTGFPYIYIMRKRKIKILWLFPVTITEVMEDRYISGGLFKRNIKTVAARVVNDLKKRVLGDTSLYGDYPPKSLDN